MERSSDKAQAQDIPKLQLVNVIALFAMNYSQSLCEIADVAAIQTICRHAVMRRTDCSSLRLKYREIYDIL